MLLERSQDLAEVEKLLANFRRKGIEMLIVSNSSATRPEEVLTLISAGKLSFLLSFNANTNTTSDYLYRIRRKAVDLQVQIFTSKEEAEAVLLCVE